MSLTAKLLIVASILIFAIGAFGLNRSRTPNAAYGSATATGFGAAIGVIGLAFWLCSR